MTSRVIAGAVLIATAAVAWLAIAFTLAARALQAVIAISLVYVAYLALRGFQAMRDGRRETPLSDRIPPAERPWVTLLVPARNEAPIIGRTVAALAAQDYGDASGPRFDVLVVDDGSSDGTGDAARQAGASFGQRVRVVRRDPDHGARTKAAALTFALASCRGEVIGVLDADARVGHDFVSIVMDAWDAEPEAAAVQAQRRASNIDAGWRAAAQDEELLMDMASQCGRRATDGTAELRGNGMFVRRDRLARVGGWNDTALTEDLDLSTRLVTAGEQIGLAPRAEVGEEAVLTARALWRQRMRWAEGSLRRLLELGPGLVAERAVPVSRKLDFLAFTGEFIIPPLFVASLLATAVTILLPRPADWTVPVSLFIGYGLGTFLLAMGGLAAQGVRGLSLVGRATRGSLFLSHWLLIVPAALLRIAVAPRTTAFVQTLRHHRPAADD
ncbi:MAG: glycosyltransferase family 2 protein [Chloroflexota bacterium]